MAKRFTDTEKYKKPFVRSLQGPYKLLWDYLYHECDHAGIWIVDFEIAQIYLGKDMQVNKESALKFFNQGEKRVIELSGGSKWLIVPFIEFQYGELNPDNRVHKSVINILKKEGVYKTIKTLTSPLQGCKDIDMDKDKDKDKDKESKNSKKSDADENKKKFTPPEYSEFALYFTEKGFPEPLARRVYDYYTELDWKDANGKAVKNWKAKVLSVWMKEESKTKTPGAVNIDDLIDHRNY
jgi:hypothetical protein